MNPQPNSQQSIAPAIVRYLRCCHLERDFESLTAAGLHKADYRLLDDLGYWVVDRLVQPAVTARLKVAWPEIQNAIEAEEKQKSMPTERPNVYASTVTEFVDLALQSIRKSNFETAKQLGLTEMDFGFLSKFTLAALQYLETCPFTVSVKIDPDRVAAVERQRGRQHQATADCVTLIRCGATHPMLSEITGISTHEFASIRRVVGVNNHSRVANRTHEEEVWINNLLDQVCGDRHPQLRDYLKMCELTRNSINLGKVHAEVKVRYSRTQLKQETTMKVGRQLK